VNERRQRAARAVVTGLVTLSALALASGCDARTSAEGVQTAVAVAQTALPAVQTVLPGVQATAQAGATAVAGVLSDPQAIIAQLQVLLAGSSVELTTLPAGAGNDVVTEVLISATDTRGALGQLDAHSRQAAAGAAMVVVAQYYPKASISLAVNDSAGAALISGTKAAGQAPTFQ
jgi:hypothetical protein